MQQTQRKVVPSMPRWQMQVNLCCHNVFIFTIMYLIHNFTPCIMMQIIMYMHVLFILYIIDLFHSSIMYLIHNVTPCIMMQIIMMHCDANHNVLFIFTCFIVHYDLYHSSMMYLIHNFAPCIMMHIIMYVHVLCMFYLSHLYQYVHYDLFHD